MAVRCGNQSGELTRKAVALQVSVHAPLFDSRAGLGNTPWQRA